MLVIHLEDARECPRPCTSFHPITAWDGTLCGRTEPDRTCVPADFICPELGD